MMQKRIENNIIYLYTVRINPFLCVKHCVCVCSERHTKVYFNAANIGQNFMKGTSNSKNDPNDPHMGPMTLNNPLSYKCDQGM